MKKLMFEILIADDDRNVRKLLVHDLREEGYVVREAINGENAVSMFAERHSDLVLLDVDMPVMDGLAACREIRSLDAMVPILFLSGYASSNMHIAGMKAGADDYMDKTMDAEERRLRIHRALVRAMKCNAGAKFTFGSAVVDPEAFVLIGGDGISCRLTTREVEILRYLSENRGKVITWDAFQTRFWGVDDEDSPDKLRQSVCRLREKLGISACCLTTVKGVGVGYFENGIHISR